MRRMLLTTLGLLLALTTTSAEEKKEALTLKVVAKKDKYAWDRAQAPKEFQDAIEDQLKKQMEKKLAQFPDASAVDLVLQITNVGQEAVTIYVGGDPNTYQLELKGPKVLTALPPKAFTADFKLPKAVTLEAGKSHEVPVKALMDGLRGASRHIYWVAPGEYTLYATYQLTNKEGEKGTLLKSEEVKLILEEPKK